MVKITVKEQRVGNQYIADTMTFGAVQDKTGLIVAMEALEAQVTAARSTIPLTEAQAKDVDQAKDNIAKAVSEAKAAVPDQSSIMSHMKLASNALGAISALGSLAKLVERGVDAVKHHL